MRWRIPLVLILALFVAVSCDQQPNEPVGQSVATAPEFNFMTGPAFPGNSGMERLSSNETFNYTLDFEAPWLLVTYDPFEAYAGCTLDFPDDAPPWDIQEKQRETKDGVLTTRLLQGDLDVTLYDHFIWDTEYTSVCEFLVNDCRPKALVMDAEYASIVSSIQGKVPSVERIVINSPAPMDLDFSHDRHDIFFM